MRRIRKFLSVILATLMVISIIPITASAEVVDGTCGVNVTWTFDEATKTVRIMNGVIRTVNRLKLSL